MAKIRNKDESQNGNENDRKWVQRAERKLPALTGEIVNPLQEELLIITIMATDSGKKLQLHEGTKMK
nr:MAG: hypothetical protein OI716_00415 [Candidatus Methanoperedens sp.]